MMNENEEVEKLRGEQNWTSYQILMKAILECDEVFEVVDGIFQKPVVGSKKFEVEMEK